MLITWSQKYSFFLVMWTLGDCQSEAGRSRRTAVWLKWTFCSRAASLSLFFSLPLSLSLSPFHSSPHQVNYWVSCLILRDDKEAFIPGTLMILWRLWQMISLGRETRPAQANSSRFCVKSYLIGHFRPFPAHKIHTDNHTRASATWLFVLLKRAGLLDMIQGWSRQSLSLCSSNESAS